MAADRGRHAEDAVNIEARFCERLYGGSVRDCACRLPDGGGWLECPPEARGILALALAAPLPSVPPRQGRFPSMAGEFCHSCGSPNMIRTGTCLTCGDCGDSSGGCS